MEFDHCVAPDLWLISAALVCKGSNWALVPQGHFPSSGSITCEELKRYFLPDYYRNIKNRMRTGSLSWITFHGVPSCALPRGNRCTQLVLPPVSFPNKTNFLPYHVPWMCVCAITFVWILPKLQMHITFYSVILLQVFHLQMYSQTDVTCLYAKLFTTALLEIAKYQKQSKCLQIEN